MHQDPRVNVPHSTPHTPSNPNVEQPHEKADVKKKSNEKKKATKR